MEKEMKVYELAKELGITSTEIKKEFPELKSHLSCVSSVIEDMIRAIVKDRANAPEEETPEVKEPKQEIAPEVIPNPKPITKVVADECPYDPEFIELSIRGRGHKSPCWPWRALAAKRPKNKYSGKK